MAPVLSRLELLPDELLLQVARQLEDGDLATCSRVSRKVRSIAQDILYRDIELEGHCFMSGAGKVALFLRTLIERPDLAQKVDTLQFLTSRRNVTGELKDHGVEFGEIRQLALNKVDELGYGKDHPWCRMMGVSINSAFGGLLLVLVPHLRGLTFGVYDNHHGLVSSEPFFAMYGTPAIIEPAVPMFRNLNSLGISADHLPILYLDMPHLTALTMDKVTTVQMCRLNGPGSLKGGFNLKELKLELVAQVADADLMDALQMSIADLLDAMGNPALTSFNTHIWSESFTHGHPSFDANFFIVKGLEKVAPSIQNIEIWIRHNCAHGDGEWILDHTKVPITNLKNFTSLKRLSLPYRFLALPSNEDSPDAENIDVAGLFPASLRTIELIYPYDTAVQFLREIVKKRDALPLLKKIGFVCSVDIAEPAELFWSTDMPEVKDAGICCDAVDHDTEEVHFLGHYVGIDSDDDEEEEDDDDLPELEELPEVEEMD
ncbi:hypothetical protein BDV96DRAFT_647231 [Lophiotrema nucula]|uniref:F-box domain-containing protein n=1 Tax=Lophiotrema nucula TaxID=690887 RepID=A0A6A5Z4W9_9PLEO|nr:hypothetical protein BDV96DRAFT_647231 [Lophiotrema nucula]